MKKNETSNANTTDETQVTELMQLEKIVHDKRLEVDRKMVELFAVFKEYQVTLQNLYNKLPNIKNELK